MGLEGGAEPRPEGPTTGAARRSPIQPASTRKKKLFMAKHLNPLEKEFLIRQYRSNQRISIKDFCEANHLTEPSLKKWMRQYDEGGLEGLARADANIKVIVPDGFDRTEESYKREILKLRIENERLKKSYAVRMNSDGEPEFVRLKEKSSK